MAQIEVQFTAADREAVNQAVKNAESQTRAEIIPVIAACSGRYDRSEDVFGLWVGLAAFLLVWKFVPAEADPSSWGTPSPVLQFIAYAAAIVCGFLGGAAVASRTGVIRRLFTPARQMSDEVRLRARAVFFDQRVHHTSGSSGVLLYVSLFERMATVLADQSVMEKLSQTQIDSLCAEFTQRLHSSSPVTALTDTIRIVGTQLSEVLPRTDQGTNELADALVLLE